jgi:hypothetical protein
MKIKDVITSIFTNIAEAELLESKVKFMAVYSSRQDESLSIVKGKYILANTNRQRINDQFSKSN